MPEVTRVNQTCRGAKVYHRAEWVAGKRDERAGRRRRAGKQYRCGLKGEEGLEINLD